MLITKSMAKKAKESLRVSYASKLLAFTNALKDSITITFAGVPLRANEITLTVLTIKKTLLNKAYFTIPLKEILLLLLLCFNLICTCIVGRYYSASVDITFQNKYIIRNILYVILMFCFIISRQCYKKDDVIYQCKVMVYLNIIFGLVAYTTGYRLYLSNWLYSRFGEISFLGLNFLRFSGTASEAGYLGPFLMMPLYYFLHEYIKYGQYKTELIILFLILFLTFSAAVYALTVFCYVYVKVGINQNVKNKNRYYYKLFYSLFIIIVILVLLSISYHLQQGFKDFLDRYFVIKIAAFSGVDGYSDFSGNDRNMHYINCFSTYIKQSIFHKIFGIGTGGYSFIAQRTEGLYLEANEAYNIFLSTLLDRGLIGLIVLIGMGFIISKFRIEDDTISNAIYAGIVSQYLHWMITGNMWLCYFWIEVMYLIGYYRWKKKYNV